MTTRGWGTCGDLTCCMGRKKARPATLTRRALANRGMAPGGVLSHRLAFATRRMTMLSQLAAALADRYAIDREIGAGGMATVYLARDRRHDRPVAVKVLNPEIAAVLGVERFLAEIRVTANLQHPNILPLFDSGEARPEGPNGPEGSSFLYYVMPYVDGETLR